MFKPDDFAASPTPTPHFFQEEVLSLNERK